MYDKYVQHNCVGCGSPQYTSKVAYDKGIGHLCPTCFYEQNKAIEPNTMYRGISVPIYRNKDLEDFIAKGDSIEDIVLVTSHDVQLTEVETDYGMLKVRHNPYLPKNTSCLVRLTSFQKLFMNIPKGRE